MPYSSESGKRLVDRALLRLQTERGNLFFNHHKVLDVGAGSGTYFDRYSKSLLPSTKFIWDAVEIWEPYLEKFSLRDKYSSVHVQDAISFLKSNTEFYDVIFMGDVIEHMTKEQAVEMVQLAQQVSHLIIVSVPVIHYPQDEFEGNPYEAHVKDDWSKEEMLETFGSDVVHWGVENEIGVFMIGGSNDGRDMMLRSTLGPRIGVYAIGKNEMQFMERFVENVMDADDLVICDTGSTDGTWEGLQDFEADSNNAFWAAGFDLGLKEPVCCRRISVTPWRFDDARNTALALLRPDLDICVSIDFDELLQDGWHDVLAEEVTKDLQTRGYVIDRWNHRFSTIWDWQEEGKSISEHWHERIHTRNNYMWKLPVHEVLVKVNGSEEIKWLGGFMMTQKPDVHKSRSSYLKLLEMSVREDPTRWKSWSFLAGDLFTAYRHHEAFEAIETAKKCPGADVAYLCNQKSRFHQAIGQFREAVSEMMNACMLAPHLREFKVYVARIHHSQGDKVSAANMLRMAKAITDRTYGYEYDPSCWGEEFDKLCEECGA